MEEASSEGNENHSPNKDSKRLDSRLLPLVREDVQESQKIHTNHSHRFGDIQGDRYDNMLVDRRSRAQPQGHNLVSHDNHPLVLAFDIHEYTNFDKEMTMRPETHRMANPPNLHPPFYQPGYPRHHNRQSITDQPLRDYAASENEDITDLETGKKPDYYPYHSDNDLDLGSDMDDMHYVENPQQPNTQFPNKVRDWKHYLNIKGYIERDLRREAYHPENEGVMPSADVQRQLMNKLFDAALDCGICQDPVGSIPRKRMENGYYPAKDIEMLCWDTLVTLYSSVDPERG